MPGLGALQHPIETLTRWFEERVLRATAAESAQRGEEVFLFFDEVQNLIDWAPQLKALVDHVPGKVVVTGGSALRIARGRDSLAGRMNMLELGPLRLWEIAGLRGDTGLKPVDRTVSEWRNREFWFDALRHADRQKQSLELAFGAFSRFGGYPLCHATPTGDEGLLREQILENVVKRTIETDLVARDVTLDQRLLREAFRLVCRYTGQSVNPVRIATELGELLRSGVPRKQVDEALRFFSDAMLIHLIPAMEALNRRQASPPKICLCDHFVRGALLQERVPLEPIALRHVHEAVATQAGHILEGAIGFYLEGIAGLDVSWYPRRQDEPEVDFVLTVGTTRIPIEIKYRRSSLGALGGLHSFCRQSEHAAEFGIVITQDNAGQIDDRVIAVPASAFLLLV